MSFDYEDELGGPASQGRARGSAGRQEAYGRPEQGYAQGSRVGQQRPYRPTINDPQDAQMQRRTAGSGQDAQRQRQTAGGEQYVQTQRRMAGGRQDGQTQQPVGRRVKPYRPPAEEETFSGRVAQIREDLNRKKKRRRRIIAMIVAECLVLTAIFSYAYVSRMWNLMPKPNVNKENVENPNISLESINKMQGYWMVAIFGVDSGTGTSSARGNSSDVNIIACINQDTGEIKLVSLYRDTYLKVNDKGTYRKFNYAYSEGGPEQALKMLNENLDLNITEYIIFNWKAVADGINILGGVDMEITKSEFKFINAFITETVQETGVASRHLQSAGMNHLDGIQAVAYGRLRLMDSDYQRVERQKKVIEAAFTKAKKADYSVLNNILVVCLQEVMTNLDFGDLTNVALNMGKYHIGDTAGFPFDRSEANLGQARGACIIPQTLTSNVNQLHQFLFGDTEYEPTEAVKKISEKISSDSGVYAVQSRPSTTEAQTETRKEGSETEDDTEETDEDERAVETDENGVIIESRPGIGETDENGELIDGPEPDESDFYDPEVESPSPGSEENHPSPNWPGAYPSQGAAGPGVVGPGSTTSPGGPGFSAGGPGDYPDGGSGETGVIVPPEEDDTPGGGSQAVENPGGDEGAEASGGGNSYGPGGGPAGPGSVGGDSNRGIPGPGGTQSPTIPDGPG